MFTFVPGLGADVGTLLEAALGVKVGARVGTDVGAEVSAALEIDFGINLKS